METLGQACEKTGWRIHAYVLMGNHYHLLVETLEGNLVSGVKWVQGAYTQRYNSRHELLGRLFQGRYKAVIVGGQDANYFSMVSTYIHLNPARAKLIRIGAGRLSLGHYTRVTQAISRVGAPARPKDEPNQAQTSTAGQREGNRTEKCHNSRTDPYVTPTRR